MLEKRADFEVGKSFKDDGSGKKATRAPSTIDELLKDDLKLQKIKSKDEKINHSADT